MRLRILLFLCVGKFICLLRLKDWSKFMNDFVLKFFVEVIWKLKLLDINKDFGNKVKFLRNEVNFFRNKLIISWLFDDGS